MLTWRKTTVSGILKPSSPDKMIVYLQVLRAIATLPEYQGKGCASMLLQSGLDKIDAEGAKAWLEATPQGQSLYAKFGWKVVDEMVFDLEKYGCGKWVQRTTVMERSSQVKSEDMNLHISERSA